MEVIIQTIAPDKMGPDYREALIIKIDGKVVFSACDGEPEDNSLARNFNDCLIIGTLMKMAWLAGTEHQKFDLTHKEIDWEDF